ncbi:hypothetical protein ABLG96_01830 [Nakamurella sp. A5-74]|uniref:Uncharacterized protein n=1 Tax=Nakamurella sp. A5-74 TaxID=3158264 RepID=A0AAU8DQ43_9ACTN
MVEEQVPERLRGRLKLWKAVGDELLFVVDVDEESEVHDFVSAWVRAMDGYEAMLSTKNHEMMESGASSPPLNSMKTKGGAFVATFPEPDYEIVVAHSPSEATSDLDPILLNERLKEHPSPGNLQDFLGTSIDTGFRVSARASQRYFTLSLEVAWAFAQHLKTQTNEPVSNMVLLEEIALKGVWGGRAYPLFAIDRAATDSYNQAMQRMQNVPHLKAMDICNLAESCHSDKAWPSLIHFPASTFPAFTGNKDRLESAQTRISERTDRSAEGDELRELSTEAFSADEDVSNMRVQAPPADGSP